MSISTKSLLEISKINLTTEQMAVVLNVLAFELAPLEELRFVQENQNSLRRERNSRYYQSKRLLSVLKDDEQDGVKTQKVPSPLSPSFSPIPPITTPYPPSTKKIDSAVSERSYFDIFKASYPKRAGNADWKGAEKAFKPAIKRASPELIISKAREYSSFCDATGKTATEFVKQARSWLNGDGWDETYKITKGSSQNGNNSNQNFSGSAKRALDKIIDEIDRREGAGGGGFDTGFDIEASQWEPASFD